MSWRYPTRNCCVCEAAITSSDGCRCDNCAAQLPPGTACGCGAPVQSTGCMCANCMGLASQGVSRTNLSSGNTSGSCEKKSSLTRCNCPSCMAQESQGGSCTNLSSGNTSGCSGRKSSLTRCNCPSCMAQASQGGSRTNLSSGNTSAGCNRKSSLTRCNCPSCMAQGSQGGSRTNLSSGNTSGGCKRKSSLTRCDCPSCTGRASQGCSRRNISSSTTSFTLDNKSIGTCDTILAPSPSNEMDSDDCTCEIVRCKITTKSKVSGRLDVCASTTSCPGSKKCSSAKCSPSSTRLATSQSREYDSDDCKYEPPKRIFATKPKVKNSGSWPKYSAPSCCKCGAKMAATGCNNCKKRRVQLQCNPVTPQCNTISVGSSNLIICPNCRQYVTPIVVLRRSAGTIAAATMSCLLCLWPCAACVYFCPCKELAQNYCPICGSLLFVAGVAQ